MVQISLRLGRIDALADELNCHWREGSRERRRAARWSISQACNSIDIFVIPKSTPLSCFKRSTEVVLELVSYLHPNVHMSIELQPR